ncbi:hypothetical protein GUITHDRAFT_107248 [Guillardia theta CCMP2712]|uniref:Uncharacterized protein n=1 Tax=Guillardia theta (strain CCMP2712) TaxID=905079 RepID=L1JEE1_GUITC|nr:hypothetical protein GUITHDRAFT_107248 [Guillardia theta CCMP2712]EKX46893.1 hypothetical protein GUITHDRAFT_107248 [Guillardia theta CCMP2712]|eukprot:XP_005833873.1 hypothetical protein GUITHDRAFT_107248 [Guillardia theta CCMP2712]
MDMLEDVERRNPWSTAQELLEMVDNGDLKLPYETVSNFRRLIKLHERSIDHERILEMTNQGLQLERCGRSCFDFMVRMIVTLKSNSALCRDIFLAKMREIDGICAMGLHSDIETVGLESHVLMNAQEVLHSENSTFVVKQGFV